MSVVTATATALARCLALVAAVTTLVQPVTATVAAGQPPAAEVVAPQNDPFYRAPSSIAALAPGSIVASRRVAPSVPNLPPHTSTWQISFRSNDSHDSPILGITTLLVPETPWRGPGQRPAVSIQFAEDSVAATCAPSYTLRSAASSGMQAYESAPAIEPLRRGWVVAVPDHEGPRSAFSAGLSGGHIVLDAIRAAQRFRPAGLTPTTRWGLAGYSGGAAITGWAAQLQSSYAPRLTIVGAAMGGTPADLNQLSRLNQQGPAAALVIATLAGIDAEYPEAGIRGLLNSQGVQAFSQIRQICLEQALTTPVFTGLRHLSATPDLLADPRVAATLARNSLGDLAPKIPVYDYHALLDEVVPAAQDDDVVHRWCAGHTAVQIARDAFEHVSEGVARSSDAMNYLADRFTGRPAPDGCR